jgi:bifunctional non-homologous end joining protein LigD
VTIEGRELSLSNLEKELYPEAGFSKGAAVDYAARIAPVLVPHLAGRALTLKRYPNGVTGQHFYEKRCPSHAPAWVRRTGGDPSYVVADDVATLVWLANLACLELHPSLALADDPATPTVVAFDLDPGPPANVLDCAALALDLRGMLAGLGLGCHAKTSGSKGMQVYLPLNAPATFAATRAFAKAVAETLEQAFPARAVSTMAKERRSGRVFVDWAQNHESKTTIAVYSLRAMSRPTVSTPVTWDEVQRAVDARDARLLTFDAATVLARVEQDGDLFAAVLTDRQSLPDTGS